MHIRARVPLRVSFGGGGTDVSPYCDRFGGYVVNATVSKFATVTLRPTENHEVTIRSIDYDVTVNYAIDNDFVFDGQLDLVKAVIRRMRLEYGLDQGAEIYIQCDAPPGSGLGSSSAICVALIGAFQEWLRLPLTLYDVAETAFAIERIEMGLKGGKQDQFAAAFGGFNYMEFYAGKSIINPLRLRKEIVNELEHSLVLAYIGNTRESARIIERQVANVANEREDSLEAVHRVKELAVESKNALVLGDLPRFGRLLDEAWRYKKAMAQGISNPEIDQIYEAAKAAGALGGKISGAGGGGFIFFYSDVTRKYDVERALKRLGAEVVRFTFIHDGLETWRING